MVCTFVEGSGVVMSFDQCLLLSRLNGLMLFSVNDFIPEIRDSAVKPKSSIALKLGLLPAGHS